MWSIVEGSLEVKFPKKWTDKAAEVEESEKRKEERRSERRKEEERRSKKIRRSQ